MCPWASSGLGRGGVASSPNRPYRLVRHDELGNLLGRQAIEAVLDLTVEDRERFLALRSSRVSPTQTMGVSPATKAAVTLRFTITSVSPNNRRRSECPMITHRSTRFLDHL